MSDQHNVLVTGANSDIGAELCHYFLDNGDNVFAMVNSSSDSLEELSDRLSEIVKLDFSNSDNV